MGWGKLGRLLRRSLYSPAYLNLCHVGLLCVRNDRLSVLHTLYPPHSQRPQQRVASAPTTHPLDYILHKIYYLSKKKRSLRGDFLCVRLWMMLELLFSNKISIFTPLNNFALRN